MVNKDQKRDSPPGAARPPPSRRGRPAIPGRAIAPTVSPSPGVPPRPSPSLWAQPSPCDPATRAFPSPPPPGSGRGRWERAPAAGWFSGRTGTRDNGPQRGLEGDARILGPGDEGKDESGAAEGVEESRARLTSIPELGLQPQTRPPTQLKLGEIKGTTGRGWR